MVHGLVVIGLILMVIGLVNLLMALGLLKRANPVDNFYVRGWLIISVGVVLFIIGVILSFV